MFIVKRYSEEDKTNWDKFILESKNGLFFFQRNFLEYHKDRFEDHSLVFVKQNKIVAVFPANQKGDIIVSHGGLTFGSLVMGFDLKATEVLTIFNMLTNYYREVGIIQIIYKAIPYIFHKYPSSEDRYALFRNEALLVKTEISSVIAISNRLRFSETKRQLISKCITSGITVEEGVIFNEYWQLLTQVLAKFNTLPVHTIDEISLLKKSFPNNIKLYEGKRNGVLLGGVIIFDFGETVHTQYMAASPEGRKIGILDYINHFLLETLYNEKKYYSFGISTEENGKILNEGLIMQKENMGARGINLDVFQINL